ncbi:MAG: hypothetical protein IT532_03170 [Burkholderiales bacterium]|nr:hypothetical protein [Burkholderiales bacterium]
MAAPPRLIRMRTGWLVNIVLVAVVAALAAYAFYRTGRDDPQREPIAHLAASVVQRIAIEANGVQTIELAREGDAWFVTRPLRARANSTQVDRILDLLAVQGRERMPAQDLQRFDLGRPTLRVRFDETAIAFGTINPLTQDQYVLVGDAVFMIPSHHRAAIPDRVERVLTHALLRTNEKPVAFEFANFSVARADGRWARNPQPADGALSQDDFNRWVDEWRYASSLLTQPASGKLPAERIAVAFEDGRRVEFGIVQREPELVLVRADEALTFYFSQDTRGRLLAGPMPQPSPAATSAAVPAVPAAQR